MSGRDLLPEVTVILRGGKTVAARLRKSFGPFRLVTWRVRESWDGTPPFTHYWKTRWKPKWRVLPGAAADLQEGEKP